MLQGDELEIDHLDKRPDHPVGREGGPVVLLELLGRRGAFHDGHGGEEYADEGGGEEKLVAGYAG